LGFEDRDLEAGEGFGDVASYCSIHDFTIYRKCGFQVFFKYGGFFDEVDDVLGCPNVVGAGLDGDEYEVGGADGTAGEFGGTGWAVDDDVGVVGGEFWDFAVEDGPIDRDHSKRGFVRSGGGPVAGAALGVGVDEEDGVLFVLELEGVAEVDGEGGFADAAFLVLDGDDHGDWGGRKVWFRISRLVIFYDKPDLRVSGFQVLQKYGWRLKPRLHERNPPSRAWSLGWSLRRQTLFV
jgi:hypothetical protein